MSMFEFLYHGKILWKKLIRMEKSKLMLKTRQREKYYYTIAGMKFLIDEAKNKLNILKGPNEFVFN